MLEIAIHPEYLKKLNHLICQEKPVAATKILDAKKNEMQIKSILTSILALGFGLSGCAQTQEKKPSESKVSTQKNSKTNKKMEIVTLGAGCFWCVESIFQNLNGVEKVVSGYSGGSIVNPSYKEVCSGTTGHAEVAQITFDPNMVSFSEILEVFFQTHDPTTLNRQGNDAGTQYRSAIFYHSDAQKTEAMRIIQALNNSGAWQNPIVTEVTAFSKFYHKRIITRIILIQMKISLIVDRCEAKARKVQESV